MARAHQPGSLEAAAQAAFRAVGVKRAAAALGCDTSLLSHWLGDPCAGRARMPAAALDLLARQFPDAAEIFARHFADIAGFGLLPPPGAEGSVMAHTAALDQQASALSGALLNAMDPAGPGGSEFTDEELARIIMIAQDAAERARAVIETASQLRGGTP